MIDGVSNRGEKRILILVDGEKNAPPTVAAELFPIVPRHGRHGRDPRMRR